MIFNVTVRILSFVERLYRCYLKYKEVPNKTAETPRYLGSIISLKYLIEIYALKLWSYYLFYRTRSWLKCEIILILIYFHASLYSIIIYFLLIIYLLKILKQMVSKLPIISILLMTHHANMTDDQSRQYWWFMYEYLSMLWIPITSTYQSQVVSTTYAENIFHGTSD